MEISWGKRLIGVLVVVLSLSSAIMVQANQWGLGVSGVKRFEGTAFMAASNQGNTADCTGSLINWQQIKIWQAQVNQLLQQPAQLNLDTAVDSGMGLGYQVSEWALQLSHNIMILTQELTAQLHRAIRLLLG